MAMICSRRAASLAVLAMILVAPRAETVARGKRPTEGVIRVELTQEQEAPLAASEQQQDCLGAMEIARATVYKRVRQGSVSNQGHCHSSSWLSAFQPFMGKIKIGTPPQTFDALFDTGSDTLWAVDAECKMKSPSSAKNTDHRYWPSKSSTFERIGEERAVSSYANNMDLSGWWVRDVVQLGEAQFKRGLSSLTVPNQAFRLICEVGGSGQKPQFDVLLGLSFPVSETQGVTHLLDNMIEQNLLSEPIFSFYTNMTQTSGGRKPSSSRRTGELIIGKIDDSLYTGPITWVPLTHTPLWMIRIHGVQVVTATGDIGGTGGRPESSSVAASACMHGYQAILDSGTNQIIGPSAEVETLNAAMGFARQGARGMDPNGFIAKKPCSELPNMTLVFHLGQDQYLKLKREMLVIDWAGRCMSALRSNQAAEPLSHWNLGTPLIASQYTIFDYGQKRVGFARSVARA